MLGVQGRVMCGDHASVTNDGRGHSGYNEYMGSADGECRSIGMEAWDGQQHDNKVMPTSDERAMVETLRIVAEAHGVRDTANRSRSSFLTVLSASRAVEPRSTLCRAFSANCKWGRPACYGSRTSGRPARLVFPTP
jgi:hypothetical protein